MNLMYRPIAVFTSLDQIPADIPEGDHLVKVFFGPYYDKSLHRALIYRGFTSRQMITVAQYLRTEVWTSSNGFLVLW